MSSADSISDVSGQRAGLVSTGGSPFDKLASEYDSWFDKDGKLIFRIELQAFKTVLPSLPRPWLEIGVGSGRFAQALGIETGIDPSTGLIELAKQRGIEAFRGRGEQTPFDKCVFGTIFLIVTLCFLSSPLAVMKEASRILAPGGRLVLGLVLKESPWGKLYRRKKEDGHPFYKHATFYNHDEVVSLSAKAGFVTDRTVSTLFQRPGEVQNMEEPVEGYFPAAGFVIIIAAKTEALDK
jgi:SAM-dependent methyltransferase